MRKTTIRWRIFKYNLTVILLLMALIAVIFNIAVGRYFERSITGQMERIGDRTEGMALLKGPEFFMTNDSQFPPPEGLGPVPPIEVMGFSEVSPFYFMLDRSLREPLSVLDADYLLLDTAGERITLPQDQFRIVPEILQAKLKTLALEDHPSEGSVIFTLENQRYITVVKPVSDKNTFGLGWLILYSSLEKVDRIQGAVNVILLAILVFSATFMAVFSSHLAQLVCAPFAQLDRHIRILAERNFGMKLELPVDEELQGLVDTVNHLSEMLEKHDQAQKTFLQNVSHEFRTPLMVIQSHAEGIRHQVVAPEIAADIVLTETGRLTQLVENLLYLSRLDALEEVYAFTPLDLNVLVGECVRQMQGMAEQSGILLNFHGASEALWISGDEEKLSRAVMNLISNGIRHAKGAVSLMSFREGAHAVLTVCDDGAGVTPEDLPHLFKRFYRGSNGKFGLGLAIVKAVADRHQGTVSVENGSPGARFSLRLKRLEHPEDKGVYNEIN